MRKGMSLFLAAVTMAATVAGAGVCVRYMRMAKSCVSWT